ncbi:hypothetical protein [Pedobacter miscanthi]|uniref:hypothetical protein n=1 Tax=Pedobacter miscanthi TaxID=2259170 RepID=UPI002931675D|nr:hypothetical protein [Pedobacter miscanthi]
MNSFKSGQYIKAKPLLTGRIPVWRDLGNFSGANNTMLTSNLHSGIFPTAKWVKNVNNASATTINKKQL